MTSLLSWEMTAAFVAERVDSSATADSSPCTCSSLSLSSAPLGRLSPLLRMPRPEQPEPLERPEPRLRLLCLPDERLLPRLL